MIRISYIGADSGRMPPSPTTHTAVALSPPRITPPLMTARPCPPALACLPALADPRQPAFSPDDLSLAVPQLVPLSAARPRTRRLVASYVMGQRRLTHGPPQLRPARRPCDLVTLYRQGALTIAPSSGPCDHAIRTSTVPGELNFNLLPAALLLRVGQVAGFPENISLGDGNADHAAKFPAMPRDFSTEP